MYLYIIVIILLFEYNYNYIYCHLKNSLKKKYKLLLINSKTITEK